MKFLKSFKGATVFLVLVTLPKSILATSQSQLLDSFPPENSTDSVITWKTCSPNLFKSKSLQCATFSVPIDWESPHGEHFKLGLVKLPAAATKSTSPKLGALFVNPGGPGGLASELVDTIALGAIQNEAFLSSFDIIGLDPRGVGLSHKVQCDMSVYAERVSSYPQSHEELARLLDKNRRFGESCLKLTGPLLGHLDTVSAAKDHEAVRVALGNEPINFFGMSYGTQLGAQYAALFPDNIRTLALDGIVQHSQAETSNYLLKATSYALVLSHFLDWASTNESSVLKGQNVEALWTELLMNSSVTPIPASSCDNIKCRSDVNAEEILYNAQTYLRFPGKNTALGASWDLLASALYDASNGNASTLSISLQDPGYAPALAISCLDWTQNSSSSLADILAQLRMTQEYAPLTYGTSPTWSLQHGCLGWPLQAVNPPTKLNIKTNATILMTQSTRDPSTGLPWALGMLEEIENRVLVLRDGDGHTSLPLGGKTAETIVKYLITGQAPEEGLVLDS